jgi:DNA polymerase III alpha subunit (gram-positive type)
VDLLKDKYIILEIIPTGINKEKGSIIELTALKLDGLNLIDRFNYRLNEDKVEIPDFLNLINYDKELFNYVDSTEEILKEFQTFIEDKPLLIIDNAYTKNFLIDIPNKKESIFKYLDKEYHDQIIEELVKEYNIEPTNYIVDILYESLLKHL